MYRRYLTALRYDMEGFELDIDAEEFTTSTLFRAIKAKDPQAVLQAIYSGENVHLVDSEFNSTFLHLVVCIAEPFTEDKFVPIIYQLSNAGLDVNARDYKGRTALELCVYRELHEIMVALLRVGVDPSDKDYKSIIRNQSSPFETELIDTFDKYLPGLWTAVSNNDTGMVHMLVNSWCRVNIVKNGKSLIQYAKETYKNQDLITLLEDFEVTIEFVHGTLAGDEKRMLEFLMDAKPCDPNIMDISYQEKWSQPLQPRSLRDTAIAMGHTHVLHLLPESEEETDATLRHEVWPDSPSVRKSFQFLPPPTLYEVPHAEHGNNFYPPDVVPRISYSHNQRLSPSYRYDAMPFTHGSGYYDHVSTTRTESSQSGNVTTSASNTRNGAQIVEPSSWNPQFQEGSFGYYYHTEVTPKHKKSNVSENYSKSWKKLQKDKNKSKMCVIQ